MTRARSLRVPSCRLRLARLNGGETMEECYICGVVFPDESMIGGICLDCCDLYGIYMSFP